MGLRPDARCYHGRASSGKRAVASGRRAASSAGWEQGCDVDAALQTYNQSPPREAGERRLDLDAQQTLIGAGVIVTVVAAEYVCAVWAARVGRRAGSDDPVWRLLGLFFSLIGVLAAYGFAWSRRRGWDGRVGAVLAFLVGWAVFLGGVYAFLIRE